MAQIGTVEVIAGWRPAEVAGFAIAGATDRVYSVILDLAKLDLTAKAAVAWLEEYQQLVRSLAPYHGVKPPYPIVAILAYGVDRETTTQLRSQGAVVIDRALPSNEHITNSEALAEALASIAVHAGTSERRSTGSEYPQRLAPQLPAEDTLNALNSYPAGITPEHLSIMLNNLSRDNY